MHLADQSTTITSMLPKGQRNKIHEFNCIRKMTNRMVPLSLLCLLAKVKCRMLPLAIVNNSFMHQLNVIHRFCN